MLTGSPNFAGPTLTMRSGSKFSTLKTVEIDQYQIKVTVTEGRLVGSRRVLNEWHAPVSEFNGVLRQSIFELEGGSFESGPEIVIYHNLILVPPDERKSICLYSSGKEVDTRSLWATTARFLQLPGLYETGDGMVSLLPEDVGKRLINLAREGKVSVDFDAKMSPPKGIALESGDGYQRVSFDEDYSFLRRYIVVTHGELRYYRKTPFGKFFHKIIDLTSLISVDRYDSAPSVSLGNFLYGGWHQGHGPIVKIIPIGLKPKFTLENLSNEQSHWLKNFVLAAAIGEYC